MTNAVNSAPLARTTRTSVWAGCWLPGSLATRARSLPPARIGAVPRSTRAACSRAVPTTMSSQSTGATVTDDVDARGSRVGCCLSRLRARQTVLARSW